jgi:putative membrane protein
VSESSQPALSWSDTRPRHTHPVTPVVKALRVAPGLLVFFYVFKGEGTTEVIGRLGAAGAVIAMMLATAGVAWLSWRRLTYWFDQDGDLRIHSGIWQRQERRVQVSRLQSVDVTQPLLARIFGLAQLRPEVAGSSSGGTTLEYLSLGDAEHLRAELLARAAGIAVSEHAPAQEAPERVLVRVPPKTLLASVLLQPLTAVAMVVIPVVVVGAVVFGAWGIALPTLLLIFTPVVVIANQFLTWFDFTIADSPDGLRLRFGLTSHRSQTVPPGRVQALRIECPLLWKPWGWARVTVNVAGASGGEDAQERPSVILPVAPLPIASAVLAQALPGIDPFAVPLASAPRRSRWRAPLQAKRLAVGHNNDVLVARHGWLVPMWDVVPHARTQSVRLTQGPWQRRLRLASVHIDSTPGPIHITIAHRDEGEARRILEEQSHRAKRARFAAPPERWLSGEELV